MSQRAKLTPRNNNVKPGGGNKKSPAANPPGRTENRAAAAPRAAPQPESEDEAYGGSPSTDVDEYEIPDVPLPDLAPKATPRRGLQANKRAPSLRSDTTPRSSLSNGTPAGKGQVKGQPRRVIKGKGPTGRKGGSNDIDTDETFGDEERKCVKEFKEKYATYTKSVETNEMPVDMEIQHLCALADIFHRSAVTTLNMHNVLRASGLYNICLRKCPKNRTDLYSEIKDMLTSFEDMAMKRILKLKSTMYHLFDHDEKANQHREQLNEIRNICAADLKVINDNLCEFPSASEMLKQKSASARQIQAEENIMATTALMFGEIAERTRTLLASLMAECIELQGPPPCTYALIGTGEFARKELSPFQPISVFLVIEKDSAPNKNYFRNCLCLLGMKMMNLGETSLASLNIRSLSWLTSKAEPSGFSLHRYIDDNEKNDFSTITLDCIRTPKDLLQLAVGNKGHIRAAILSIVRDVTFITGDLKLYKELLPVRTAVLNREQTEKTYKKSFFQAMKTLVTNTDPLSNFTVNEGNEEVVQQNSLTLVSKLVSCISELEKGLNAEGTINKIEEMLPPDATPTYGSVTISSDIRQTKGVVSTISTRLPTPPSRSPTPEPVKLPEIPFKPRPAPKVRKTTWTAIEENEEEEILRPRSPPADDKEALKVLKAKKAKRRSEYSRAVQAQRSDIGGLSSGGRSTATDGFPSSDFSSSTASSSGFGNTWQMKPPPAPKPKPRKKRPKTPENIPTPEPLERVVYVVQVYEGKPRDYLSTDSARNLVLLHSLNSAVLLSKACQTNWVLVQKEVKLNTTNYEAAYIRLLQIILPLILTLKPLVSGELAIGPLKKGLQKMDLNPDDDEFVVALSYFQNRQYLKCCHAIYKYLENRSDITFVGEPFPSDFAEVCTELHGDGLLTKEKLRAVYLLMANSQMRRKAYDEAIHHWQELELIVDDTVDKAYISMQTAECYAKLGNQSEGVEAAATAISLYQNAKLNDKSSRYDTELERLEQLKQELS